MSTTIPEISSASGRLGKIPGWANHHSHHNMYGMSGRISATSVMRSIASDHRRCQART
jgi:hypothetical protein